MLTVDAADLSLQRSTHHKLNLVVIVKLHTSLYLTVTTRDVRTRTKLFKRPRTDADATLRSVADANS